MSKTILLALLFILVSLVPYLIAQHEYYPVLDCNELNQSKPSPPSLYACRGQIRSCKSFLIFKSRPPYNSVTTISTLISTSSSELAHINNVTELSGFPTDMEVIVPVNCSCSGENYYQTNATYFVANYDTYFTIASYTYQGLTTCKSIKQTNTFGDYNLRIGQRLNVPLRCACPTRKENSTGTKYLLTYSLKLNEKADLIAKRFNVSEKSLLDANGFSEKDPNLYPFTTILIPLTNDPLSSQTATKRNNKKKSKVMQLYLAIGLGVGFLLLLLAVLLITVQIKKRRRSEREELPIQKDLIAEIASFHQVLRVFKFQELKNATKNFNSKNKIKGSVYKGLFGKEILAVKKVGVDISKEVKILSKINHFNTVKLQGICSHCGCCFLVYEYMKNGSLREWLNNKNPKQPENGWRRRIQIALDVANGLHYLHSFTNPVYVHKDIKSSNILLDRNMRAKIGNFSLAKTAKIDSSYNAFTSIVVGTRGYMAPEYIEMGIVTYNIDVYAFGVVLLELITGKDAVYFCEGQKVVLSAEMASVMENQDAGIKILQLLDPDLEENEGLVFAMLLVRLSLACLNREPARRPTMAEIVSSLLKLQHKLHKLENQ
ncbi:lysM domain receptor-like kinase 4 [Impatiens glandulifera]|uniref:lysM domain receptor-like kinase 4 n=1 Tax=Impatiens glandulifera TaxID=253017 RepID=UPI001FB11554|nr:lysM domain receptor-like kinase 4 [Impatiens glandulifera]